VNSRLLNLTAAVSLVLCVATMMLWVRSYYPVHDYLIWRGDSTTTALQSKIGRLWFQRWTDVQAYPLIHREFPGIWWTVDGQDVGTTPKTTLTNLGFHRQRAHIARYGQLPPAKFDGIGVPYWFVLACSAAPASRWITQLLLRRRGPGLCPSCGYDLRATPDRCPECGTVAKGKAKAAT
jgi:hypothetical protein